MQLGLSMGVVPSLRQQCPVCLGFHDTADKDRALELLQLGAVGIFEVCPVCFNDTRELSQDVAWRRTVLEFIEGDRTILTFIGMFRNEEKGCRCERNGSCIAKTAACAPDVEGVREIGGIGFEKKRILMEE